MIPFIGRRLISEPFRLASIGRGPVLMREHLMNVLMKPHRTIFDAVRLIWDRVASGRVKPSFLYRNSLGMYGLRYHAKQQSNRQSQVRLGDKFNSLGLPRLCIDFGFLNSDAQSIVRAHQILDEALRTSGKGQIVYQCPADARMQRVLEQATDGYHQLGTTRMGVDRRTSVVDRNCRVHDLDNLFIASTSVFVTGGQANPILLAATLAVRLAHHLASRVASNDSASNN